MMHWYPLFLGGLLGSPFSPILYSPARSTCSSSLLPYRRWLGHIRPVPAGLHGCLPYWFDLPAHARALVGSLCISPHRPCPSETTPWHVPLLAERSPEVVGLPGCLFHLLSSHPPEQVFPEV